MRILLYSGKGGVGKTSVAAATGVHLAEHGKKTLVMSVDPAHSLADSFDLENTLFHGNTFDPVKVADGLFLQEVNINHELKRHWKDISVYITSVLRTTGLSGVEAEEIAIFPGMEEMSAMMYVNQYRKSNEFDVIILDCAPTAESLRFISLPATLDWYMKHVFGFQRSLLKAARPLLSRVSPVELPPDSYFRNVQELFEKVEGIDAVMEDPQLTSVRLVTNAEKMVLRETQRAFVYFTLHGLTVDHIIVNRLLPEEVQDAFFAAWRDSQRRRWRKSSAILTRYHQTIAVVRSGSPRLRPAASDGATTLWPERRPRCGHARHAAVFVRARGRPLRSGLQMPFAVKGESACSKKNDELVVEVGTIQRPHRPAHDYD